LGVAMRMVSLVVVLAVVWLLLSGHYTGLLLILGALSCVFVAWIAHRMEVVDHEGHPIHISWRAPNYWLWLGWEIVKANIDVTRRILDPRLPISPTVFTVTASQKTDLGRVTYANSITLTPGTVSLSLSENEIEVHALSRDAAEELKRGAMDRQVTRFEGLPPGGLDG